TNTAPFALDQSVSNHASTGHPIRVTDRNRTAIDVVPIRVDIEPVSAIESLDSERFVELPQTDIVDLETVLLQQLGHREDRANPHFVRSAAGDRNPTVGAKRLQPTAFGLLGFHQHRSGGAVGELRGIASGDEPAFFYRLPVPKNRLQSRQP